MSAFQLILNKVLSFVFAEITYCFMKPKFKEVFIMNVMDIAKVGMKDQNTWLTQETCDEIQSLLPDHEKVLTSLFAEGVRMGVKYQKSYDLGYATGSIIVAVVTAVAIGGTILLVKRKNKLRKQTVKKEGD